MPMAVADSPNIALSLERDRLRARATRLSMVTRELGRRHERYVAEGTPRAPLQAALRDFRVELAAVRARLALLEA